MAEVKVARRYAQSLLDIGIEQNLADKLYEDMSLVLKTIHENRALAQLFKSPIINTDKKDEILKQIFSGKIQNVTLEFMRIITRKKREYYLEDISRKFIEIYKEYKGIQIAHVVTAIPVDDNLRKQMLDIIHQTTKDTIEFEEVIDPSIIGGFILRWGDHQVDASVVMKLHTLRQDFKQNLYLKDY